MLKIIYYIAFVEIQFNASLLLPIQKYIRMQMVSGRLSLRNSLLSIVITTLATNKIPKL